MITAHDAIDGRQGPRHLGRYLLFLGCTLFLQFAVIAFTITPLWDTPDEVGHMSYVIDLSKGDLPELGPSQIDSEVLDSWRPDLQSRQQRNWIAQHPPLYYMVAAVMYSGARAAGLGFEDRVRATRLTTAAFSAAAIVVLILALGEATARPLLAVATGLALAATPMYWHMASGVSHDSATLFFSAFALLCLVRFLQRDKLRWAILAGVAMGACALVKATGLVVLVALCAGTCYWILRRPWSFPRRLAAIACTALAFGALPTLWSGFNLLRYGVAFPDVRMLTPPDPDVPVEDFWTYVTTHPVWQHTLINFYGLFGWQGRGATGNSWFQMSVGALKLFSIPLVTSLVFSISRGSSDFPRRVDARDMIPLGLLAGAAWFAVLAHPATYVPMLCISILGVFLLQVVRNLPALAADHAQRYLQLLAAATFVFFSLVFVVKLWSIFNGQMRATHGRYFYPALPFALLALAMEMPRRLDKATVAVALLLLLGSGGYLYYVVGQFYVV